jgi:ribosomal protein S18 acetylase RimI-like enzyme
MIDIRPMVSSDKSPIMEILRNTPEFKPAEVIVAGELIDSYLQQGTASGYYLLTAVDDSTVQGYVCFGDTPLTEGTWDVYWIAVSHDNQGKGIGYALMSAIEDTIKKHNGRLIIIETSSTPEYEKTRRFYHRIGYTIICRIPNYYMPGDDLVIFQKILY